MAEVEDLVYQRLVELCGAIVGERVRPGGVLLEGDLQAGSCVSLRVVSKMPLEGDEPTENSHLEVTGYAPTWPAKQALAAAIRALIGYSTAGPPEISRVLMDEPGEQEDYQQIPGTSDFRYMAIFPLSIWSKRV